MITHLKIIFVGLAVLKEAQKPTGFFVRAVAVTSARNPDFALYMRRQSGYFCKVD